MRITYKSGLFELINKLTASEKRYIKQQINKSGEEKSNYAMLFNVIVKYNIYEDEPLKKKLHKTVMVKQWSRNKNYLYHYILRVLQIYYQQDAEFEIINNFQQIAILNKKGLYKDAFKLLKKTKTIAYEVDPSLLPFIARWEMTLEGSLLYDKEIIESESEIIEQEADHNWAIEVAQNMLQLNRKCNDAIINERLEGRHNRLEKICLNMLDDPIYNVEAKGSMSKWFFFTGKTVLNAQLGRDYAAFLSAKNCMLLHEETSLLKKYTPLTYISSLNNLLQVSLTARQWQEVSFLADKIEEYIRENKNSKMELLGKSIRYMAILITHINQKKFEEALQYTDEIENFIQEHKTITKRYTRTYVLLPHLVHIYVVNGHYEKAMNHLDDLIEEQQVAIYRNTSMLLKLIIFFEKNETLVLPYAIRFVYRNLFKQENLYPFERIILNLLKSSVKVVSKEELIGVFSKYLGKLKALAKTSPEAELELLIYFDYIAWIESKITGLPLLTLLQQQPTNVNR